MKREFSFHQPTNMWEQLSNEKPPNQPFQLINPIQPDAGVDELMAVCGFKVRSSDMSEVAQKLEQLERALGGDEGSDLLSQLSSETVHSNPSHLPSWVQSMIYEINQDLDLSSTSSDLSFQSSGLDDLRAIPGGAICAPREPEQKRWRQSLPPPAPAPVAQPVLVPEDSGVRLVHALLACADAIQQNHLQLAESLVNQIGLLAVSQAGSMRKVATYFGEALARRIYSNHQTYEISLSGSFEDTSLSEMLELHFYESCPYLKFSHFTANQAILEALQGYDHIHIIDFSMKQGTQWPVLIQALALRPGGPPTVRLTAIGPPQPDNTDALQQVGWRLAKLAESVKVKFEYRGFVAKTLSDITADMLNLRPDEAVAVNSVFELHRLLAKPGSFEKMMGSIRAMKPKIVTVVEQEANHNGAAFVDRFTESLYYYSSLFDSLEGSGGSKEDQVMSEVYLGKQIYNVVACEGAERVERHETLEQWRVRFGAAGFVPVGIGSNAFKQASMLLSLFGGSGVDGYRVEESDGCLTLGWHSRPLIATSAWKPRGLGGEFS